WLALLLSAAFAGLGYRLVDLQVLRHEELDNTVQHRSQREVMLQPRRGDILDVKGNILATSVQVKTVCADQQMLAGQNLEVARVLAPLLQEDTAKLAERLELRGTNVNLHLVLKRKVSL